MDYTEEEKNTAMSWWCDCPRDLQNALFAKYKKYPKQSFDQLLWNDVIKIYAEETLNDMPVEKLYTAKRHIEYMFKDFLYK